MTPPRPEDELSAAARRLVDQLAVSPPVSPAGARERVWRQLRTPSASPRARWPGFAAGVLTAAGLVGAVLFLVRSPDPLAQIIRANGMQRPLRSGEATTPLKELSLIDLHGAGQLVAGQETVARVERLGQGGLEVTLERGSLLLHVRPRAADAAFIVRTAHFRVHVIGTILRVTASPAGDSVAVGHGAVELEAADGSRTRLRAGERWPSNVANSPAPAELERLGPTELEGVTATSFGPADAAASPPSGANASGPRDEIALYDEGWAAWRTAGDRGRALAAWQEARRRFPAGVLARELDESILDALVALHRSAEAERAVAAYLQAHPDGPRAGELHFVRATLLRELDGNCERSRAELALALAQRSAPWQARALRARAACEASER